MMTDDKMPSVDSIVKKIGKSFKEDLPKKQLMRTMLEYAFTSVALAGVVSWLVGLNIWVVLLFWLFLQSIYFFGEDTAKKMFHLELIVLVAILLVGFSYQVLIVRTGLQGPFESLLHSKQLKAAVDLENPAIELQARYKFLTKEEAKKLLADNYNSPEGLLRAIDSLQKRDNLLYNSLHGKKFGETEAQPSSSSPTFTINSKSMRQNGDTTYYEFVLGDNEVSPKIKLTDEKGKNYAYSLDNRRQNVNFIGSNGQPQFWDMKPHHNWDSVISFQGIPGNTPVKISLRVFPVSI